ncbi:hypothetical protein DID88_001240 [Monilinia fructigena]|uniref:Uncharacterized protein n=1 Tax=Monilinia fructigena TaxID=38457 RepID=A0A395IZ46_9HELO|nr:hypothetical protein DID88_001240 [Monilinia fructigena]
MSTGIPRNAADSITETRDLAPPLMQTAAGVNLSENQKVLVGSVLDLFAGRPSLPKLSLWSDAATFSDPITKAEGRKQFAAQCEGAFAKALRNLNSVVVPALVSVPKNAKEDAEKGNQ